ncbi:Bug family tripartite tricarboxylate transporter substrate binding protein [Cupriavidus consociatus]|uniref:Bug family tripartite tricarboxylate transporter substrate binding protein n=1 Tax=Cupriavidus consociatus TaxID=2821357 RepID=UPI002474C18C|nr:MULTISPECIES: tripartite tricarboxylate transporter substrate-binding protein [unclassified Cupriavidus]MDK2661728.1 tripartite tricarboxylate transporter substrate-binding protein [Cupriavidus sp. LEh21]
MNRRDFNRIALTLLGTAPLTATRAAERYPAKPISLVVAYSAGGSADLRARQVGRYMSTALAQPVVVENRPGGAGNIGTQYVARARPDGYVLGIGNLGPLSVSILRCLPTFRSIQPRT